MKRWIAGLLSLVMVVTMAAGLMPTAYAAPSAADTQKAAQVVAEGGSKAAGGVSISKTIEATGLENYFDITLTVTEEEVVEESSTDVVIVMDISNTMNNDHDNQKPADAASARLAEAKAAAQEFVLEYASAPNLASDRNLALVTFNTDANVLIDLQPVNRSMINTISGITAPSGDRRFTNIEGGLRLANSILSNSDARYKYVVLITDGFPTTYTEKVTGGGRTMQGYLTSYVDRFKDRQRNRICAGTDYSDEAAQRAQNTAVAMKNAGINIVTVGIDVGSQTIQMYLDRWADATFATVDRPKGIHPNGYVIGRASSTADYKAWLGGTLSKNGAKTGLGGGPNVTTGYYSGNSQTELDAAFDHILDAIEVTSSRSIAEGKVVDPMGEYAEFIAFYNKSGDLKDALKGKYAVNAENTAGYAGTASANAIDWDLTKSGYTRSEKTVGGKTVVVYTFTLSYRVRLENEVNGFVEGADCPTNDGAKLTYEDPSDPGKEKKLEFPDPEVKGYLGELTFTKTDMNGKALQGAEFTLTHSGSCAVCSAAGNTVAIADHTEAADANGVVSFMGIPSGHEYTLSETKAPVGYQKAAGILGTVTVAYGETAFAAGNALVSGTGASMTIKNKPLEPAKFQLKATKTMDGNAPADGAYTFLLKDAAGNTLDTQTNVGGDITFKELTYNAAGTYVYEVVEQAGTAEDVIYDRTVYHATVTVAPDDAQNPTKYVASATYRDNNGGTPTGVAFANISRQPVKVELKAQKNLAGDALRDWLGQFQFTLTAVDDAAKSVLATPETVTNGDAGVVAFSGLSFEKTGTYTFRIDEVGETVVSSDAPYMEYDPSVYEVKIVITAPADTAYYRVESVTYTKYADENAATGDAYAGEVPVFSNTRHDGGVASFSFSKVGEDGRALTGAEFTLTHALDDTCGMTIAPIVSTEANGVVTFENVPSGHRYVMTETKRPTQNADQQDTTYLEALPRSVVVAFGTAYIDGVKAETADSVKVVNAPAGEARVEFKAQKILKDGPNGSKIAVPNNVFTFELTDAAGQVVGQKQNIDSTNAELANGFVDEVIFDPIFYKAAGTYTYTMKELHLSDDQMVYYDRTVYDITVEVTLDDATQTLVAAAPVITRRAPDGSSAVVDTILFENHLRAPVTVSLEASKQMTGTSEQVGTYTFALRNAETDALVAEVQNGADGKITFADVLTFDRAGTYKYYMVERKGDAEHVVFDDTRYEVTITVSAPDAAEPDDGNYKVGIEYKKGNETVAQPVFTNSYMAVLRLKKTDKGGALLAGAEFTLTHDSACCGETVEPMVSTSRSADDALVDGSEKINLIFAEIPSGHTYILSETVTPDGYHAAPDHKVVVSRGLVSIYDWNAAAGAWETEPEQGTHSIVNHPEAKVEIVGQKILAGRKWLTEAGKDEFTIVLQPEGGNAVTTVAEKETGFFTFKDVEELTYTIDEAGAIGAPKEHVYYVYEQIPTDAVDGKLNGITYDQTVFKVVVGVEGDAQEHKVSASILSYTAGKFENGVFVADASSQTAPSIHFTNTYGAEPVTVNLRGTKALEGRALHEAEFFFATYAANDAWVTPDQPIRYVANQWDDTTQTYSSVIFHDRTFTTPGVFRYVVREVNNSLGGMTYDTTEYRLTITVTDDHMGHLVADMAIAGYKNEGGQMVLVPGSEVTASGSSANAEAVDAVINGFTFRNSYDFDEDSIANLNLSATKVHDGYMHSGLFRFALYQTDATFAISGTPLQTVYNDAAGAVAFEPIQYKYSELEDVRQGDTSQRVINTYYYAVCETDLGKYDHIRYDDTIYYVTVTLYDDHRGGLGVSYSIRSSKSSEDVVEMVFYNYEEPPAQTTPTPTPTPVEPTVPGSPNTGDASNPALWIALMAAGVAAVAVLLFVTRKRKDEDPK